MSKGAFYFPFYYQRFLASCSDWNDEEVGAYVKLLIYQFDKGSVPKDMKKLVKIGNSVKKNWPLLKEKFIELPGGGLINEVMDAIRDKHLKKKDKLVENGNKGGRPRLLKQEPDGYEINNQMDIHTNMDNGLLDIGSSGSAAITQSTGEEKRIQEFLTNQSWKEEFCMAKSIPMHELELIQRDFVNDVRLKGEPVDSYKRYFTNWYNKTAPVAKSITGKTMIH